MYNKLKQSEEEVKVLDERISTIKERYDFLTKIRIIREYQDLVDDLKTCVERRNEILQEFPEIKQKQCCHPLWYSTRTEPNYYSKRRYITCKCVECDLVIDERDPNFRKLVGTNILCVDDCKKDSYTFEFVKKTYYETIVKPKEEKGRTYTKKH
ncbi:MAG: hypothetical protein PHI05_00195 [Bacilli bacterium]|nr:hypothetical protein [Bacilli bacterium]MDD4547159.1 hypothetical protein [Bacilli bacterium]